MYKLDVLISTHGNRIKNLPNVIKEKRENVFYLIAHQNHSKCNLPIEFEHREDIQYYKIDSIGVTKSRNFLINKSKSEICYFCDDDVVLYDDFNDKVFKAHTNDKSKVITFITTDKSGVQRKNFPKTLCKRNYFNILSIGTIEISFKNSIDKVEFDTDMGAGSLIPCGDEAVYISKYLKQGHDVSFHPVCIAQHDLVSSGGNIEAASVKARGVTLRRTFGSRGVIFVIPFFIFRRKLFSNKSSFIHNFIIFFKGFLTAGKS